MKKQLLAGLTSLLMLSSYAYAELIDQSAQRQAVIPSVTETVTSAVIQVNQNDTFPQEIGEGYWAMTQTIDGISHTVEFKDNHIVIHQFQCHANGNIDKLPVHSYELEPSMSGMGLKREDGTHYSELKLIKFEPKKSLHLHQNFLANFELRQAMPNGIDLHYIYSPNLAPICPKS
ncbi:hypothetical protein [Psychrobacter lutiphocae]|uniref:hypothetical protein n=1 Tax=Psychrobacter lutiphocae TaxID=540500 RepID=UPI00036ED191|nr:hypothetical protein [Psychrobacter lutiphocae]